MKGKLYGTGVGPGDPELLTLKALRLIKENPVIAVPGENKEDSVAYKIVSQAAQNLEEKEIIAVPMPMTKDEEILRKNHENAADKVAEYLDQGKNVVFITLGDPTIYSTYIYVHKIIEKRGYETEIVSGITSFCAVAARLNTSLVEKAEMLHVVPSSYGIEQSLDYPGTKILMKAGKKMKQVKQSLEGRNCKVSMIENCGMEGEKIYNSLEEINEDAGYYSLIIIKED